MAGTFGMKSQNYHLSREAGAAMLTELKKPTHRLGSTECSSCRMQMEDATKKRTLHPAQYLALAYGLLPKVEERMHAPIRELVLR
jgi:Fe-S oxidoreductase